MSGSALIRGRSSPTPLLLDNSVSWWWQHVTQRSDYTWVPSLPRDVNTGYAFSMQAPQLVGKGRWWRYLFNQYARGLQGRAQIFYLYVLRDSKDDQHPPARYLHSKGRQEMSNIFHGLILQASLFPWRSLVLSADSTNIARSELRYHGSSAEFFSSMWDLYMELLWNCTQHFYELIYGYINFWHNFKASHSENKLMEEKWLKGEKDSFSFYVHDSL